MSVLERALGPLRRRVAMMLARGVVELVDDETRLQSLQLSLLAGEVRDSVERMGQYGFTSHPLAGAEALVAFVAGNRDHGIAIAVDDRRFRMQSLEPGEVAIYTDEGDHVLLKRGGVVEVVAATKVRISAPLVEMTGDLTVAGNVQVTGSVSAASASTTGAMTAASVSASGSVTAAGKSLSTHVHSGVQTGSGNTGAPV